MYREQTSDTENGQDREKMPTRKHGIGGKGTYKTFSYFNDFQIQKYSNFMQAS